MTAPYPVDAALHHVTVTASDRQVLPVDDAPEAYLPNGQKCEGEGYVLHSVSHGSVKLVDRTEFAYANFHNGFGV